MNKSESGPDNPNKKYIFLEVRLWRIHVFLYLTDIIDFPSSYGLVIIVQPTYILSSKTTDPIYRRNRPPKSAQG